MSVDPLTSSYPWYTPYQFAGNKPIVAIDIDGLEEWFQYNVRTNVGIRDTRPLGPLSAEQAKEQGLYTRDRIQNMIFDAAITRRSIIDRETAREKAIAKRNFEIQKAKNSNFLYVASHLSDLRDYAEAGKAAYGREFGKAATIMAISFAPEALEQIAKGSVRWKTAQRLKNHVNKEGNYDISLGAKNYVKKAAKATNSVSYHHMFIKGFTQHEIRLNGPMKDWLPGVQQAISTAVSNGGKINFHFDSLTDLSAVFDKTNTNFLGGSMTELRYLIDSDNISNTTFYNNMGGEVSESILNQLETAIKTYKERSKTDYYDNIPRF